jgi:hypothetical protein
VEYHNTRMARKNCMKLWKIFLLLFVSSSLFAQPADHGYISLTRSGKSLYIPIKHISYTNRENIIIRAYGQTRTPSCNTIILSLALYNLTTDPQDINTAKSWISFESKNDSGKDFYISFGFYDSYSFSASSEQSVPEVSTLQNTLIELYLTQVEYQKSTIVLTGTFASKHVNTANGRRETIEIHDGHFVLLLETDNTITKTQGNEELTSLSKEDNFQPYSFIIVHPVLSQPVENTPIEYSSPTFSENIPDNPTTSGQSFQENGIKRTVRTGRSVQAAQPQRPFRNSPQRTNQQPQDTTAQDQRIRTLGGRRGGR